MELTGTKLRYQQAMDVLRKDIVRGKYKPGQKLPPIRTISDSLGMNYLTVRKAMKHLAEDGIVQIQHGAGTFVTDSLIHSGKKSINIALACRKFMLEFDQHHPAIGSYLAGAHRRCQTPKYTVQPMFYGEHHFTSDLGESILNQQVDGVVITGGGLRNEDYDFLETHKIPAVITGEPYRTNDWAMSVRTDSEALLRQAVEHLRLLGHKRIGFICYEQPSVKGGIHRAFAELAFEHQLGNPKELTVLVSNPSGGPHWEDVEKFFELSPLPTAAIVSDEFLADIFLASCERRAIKIPDDLSIVARQDLLPYGHRIPLTAGDGVRHNNEVIYRACDMLVNLIEGKSIADRHITLTPKLVIKASTGPVNPIRKGGDTMGP